MLGVFTQPVTLGNGLSGPRVPGHAERVSQKQQSHSLEAFMALLLSSQEQDLADAIAELKVTVAMNHPKRGAVVMVGPPPVNALSGAEIRAILAEALRCFIETSEAELAG